MNILVCGGVGFIGSHLVDALVDNGHSVRIIDSLVGQVHQGRLPDYVNNKAELIIGDVGDREVIGKALDGINVVYHQAALVGVGQSMYEVERYVQGNVLATSVLLEEIIKRKNTIKKLIVASSMSIYGEGAYISDMGYEFYPQIRSEEQLINKRWEIENIHGNKCSKVSTSETKPLFPTSIYAITKQNQEQMCLTIGKAYDIPTVALRYFNAYGTRQALSNPYTGVCAIFSSRLLNNESPIIFEDGNQTRDFVHVSDIVQANLLALDSTRTNYEAINIGTGVATSVNQVAKLLAKGLSKDIEPEINNRYRKGDIRHCYASITKAQNLLGYNPKVSLSQGIPELLHWVRLQTAQDNLVSSQIEMEDRNLIQ